MATVLKYADFGHKTRCIVLTTGEPQAIAELFVACSNLIKDSDSFFDCRQ